MSAHVGNESSGINLLIDAASTIENLLNGIKCNNLTGSEMIQAKDVLIRLKIAINKGE